MEHRALNKNFEAIAQDLINTEPELRYIKDSRARIAYLDSDQAKKALGDKLVHGECEKVQAKNRWSIPYDFTITLFPKNNVGMSEDQIRVLLFHELLHVGIDMGPDGEETYSVTPHDLMDFKIIIDRFGTDWHTNPKPGETAKE